MSFSQTQLDALDAAIATGTLTVEYDGKKITYRSLGQMIQIRNMIKAELGAGSGAPPVRTTYVGFS